MRGIVPLQLYIYAFARRRKGSPLVTFWYLVKGQLIYIFLWPWLTKPSEGASGHPVRMPSCRYNGWIKNLYGLKSRVHPSGNYVDHQRREVSTLAPYVGKLFFVWFSHWQRWPHPPEANPLVEERKIILNGVKPSKGGSWQAKNNWKLSSRRQRG